MLFHCLLLRMLQEMAITVFSMLTQITLDLKCLDDTCRMSSAPKAFGCFYRALTRLHCYRVPCWTCSLIFVCIHDLTYFVCTHGSLGFAMFSYFTLILRVVKSWAITDSQDYYRYCASLCWHLQNHVLPLLHAGFSCNTSTDSGKFTTSTMV